jgi:hypothetical protein
MSRISVAKAESIASEFWSTGGGILLALIVPTLFYVVFGTLMFRARVSGPYPVGGGAVGIDIGAEHAEWCGRRDAVGAVGVGLHVEDQRKLLTQSKFGLVVQALRGDPERVRFLGYNVALYETADDPVGGGAVGIDIGAEHAEWCGRRDAVGAVGVGPWSRPCAATPSGCASSATTSPSTRP